MVSSSSTQPPGRYCFSVTWNSCRRIRRSPRPPRSAAAKPSFVDGNPLSAAKSPASTTVVKQGSLSPWNKLVISLHLLDSIHQQSPASQAGGFEIQAAAATESAVQIGSKLGQKGASGDRSAKAKKEINPKPKPFSFRLSKEEAAEDLMLLTGEKRLPRPKIKVSKQLRAERQRLIPGLLLF